MLVADVIGCVLQLHVVGMQFIMVEVVVAVCTAGFLGCGSCYGNSGGRVLLS